MSNFDHIRTRALAISVGFFLMICAPVLRAQEPWPPSPLVPPDTTTYRISTEYGAIESVRRPPDSLIIPGELIIRFAPGALDSGKLSQTYWTYFWGHRARRKGGAKPEGEGGPYDALNQPRGFFSDLRSLLFAEQFWFDSVDNIAKDSALKRFFIGNHCHFLHRLTTASPLDTLSVTRDGDTIGCDHMNWMILEMDSDVNPLLLSGILMAEFPKDIIEAFPNYGGITLLGHVPGNTNWDCQIADSLINTPEAWDYEVGDTNIIVAHYDQGFDYRNPAFLDNTVGVGHKFIFAWDYGLDSNQTRTYIAWPRDHGTACVGVLALQTNRDSTVPAGICGGWGTLSTGTDTIDRGRGASVAFLGDKRLNSMDYIRGIFEAAAKSPVTPYGLGAHVINTSAAVQVSAGVPDVICAINYAFANGVIQTAADFEPRSGFGSNELGGFPAAYDPSWMICVGASWDSSLDPSGVLLTKMPGSDYGYTMDILAPGGDPTHGSCNLPNLVLSSRDTSADTATHHYFYGGYGGTSIAAPQVAGSATLLLSYFRRRDTAHMMHVEPEDVQGILCASAWRGDLERDSLSTRDLWRPWSGYGYLNVGNAFQMMDTTLSIKSSHYRLIHDSVTDLTKMAFSDWFPDTGAVSWLFWVPTDVSPIDSIKKYRERSYMLSRYGGRWNYMAQSRIVTTTFVLPDTFEMTDATPMFVWGRSGGPTAKSGWSLDQQNFQTGFTEVINGSGDTLNGVSQSGGYQEGIFHNNDTVILQTYQYKVWGYDTLDGQYDVYLGHCPRDTSLGLNFSVFARPQIADESVAKVTPEANMFEILQDPQTNSATAYFQSSSPLYNTRMEIYDDIGRLVAALPQFTTHSGWNQISLPVTRFANGIYFCRVTAANYSEAKSFSIAR